MKLEQQVCSLDLAKRLKEFGVKQESYFYWWTKDWNDREVKPAIHTSSRVQSGNSTIPVPDCYSAFTVAELGEMLPDIVGDAWLMCSFCKNAGKYDVEYVQWVNSSLHHIYSERGENEADARAKMLIYLLENKLITL